MRPEVGCAGAAGSVVVPGPASCLAAHRDSERRGGAAAGAAHGRAGCAALGRRRLPVRAISGGGPPRPRLCCVPMKIGLTSCSVSSCVRTMRGVSSMTMSVCVISVSFDAKRLRRIGRRRSPGMPRSERRSSSRSRPASRFDSPSRSRSRVFTFRDPNDGRFCPAMLMS